VTSRVKTPPMKDACPSGRNRPSLAALAPNGICLVLEIPTRRMMRPIAALS
jgi:hypothetical protein